MTTSLPIYTSALIGRVRECRELTEILQHPSHQLVTLIGASGAGKTRLGIQVCTLLQENFKDGIFFIPLAPTRNIALVLPAIATALNIRENSTQSLLELLIEYCTGKQMLLMLDNMEQLLGIKQDIQTLIDRVPSLTIFITTQQALELDSEYLYIIPPLEYPTNQEMLSIEKLEDYTAIALFINRMQIVQPDFSLNKQNAADVVEICQIVQGLPLAIELIAAHSDILTPDILLLLLKTHLSIHRQKYHVQERIVMPILSWCYGRLTQGYQWLFPKFSVMRGGFTLQSIEAIMQGIIPPSSYEDTTITDYIQQVIMTFKAKNLLIEEQVNDTETRYQMLDVVHEFGINLFQKQPDKNIFLQNYADYFLNLAQQGLEALKGPDYTMWIQKFTLEKHNLYKTYDYFLDHDLAKAIHINTALARFHYFQGSLSEALRSGEYLLTCITEPFTDNDHIARLYYDTAFAASSLQKISTARAYYQKAGELFALAHNSKGQGSTFYNLGLLELNEGNLDTAHDVIQQSITIYEQLDDPWQQANALNTLGIIALNKNQLQKAQSYYTKSLECWDAVNYLIGKATALNNIGDIHLKRKNYEDAQTFFEQAYDIYQHNNGEIYLGNVCIGLAQSAYGLNLPELTYSRARQATLYAQQAQNSPILVEGLETIARICVQTEQWNIASKVLGVAQALRQELNLIIQPHDEQWVKQVYATVNQHRAIPVYPSYDTTMITELLETSLPSVLLP